MPTFSTSSAVTSGLASLLAGSALAPTPASEGDAFAAMLAGLAPPPAGDGPPPPGISAPPFPAAVPIVTTMPRDDAALPVVRQDPAAWLPWEGEAPDLAPVLSMPKDLPKPLVFGLDCEMPATDPGLPQAAVAPVTVLPQPIEPAVALPKPWIPRLSSSLTPARFAPEPGREDTDATAEPSKASAIAPDTIVATPAPPTFVSPIEISKAVVSTSVVPSPTAPSTEQPVEAAPFAPVEGRGPRFAESPREMHRPEAKLETGASVPSSVAAATSTKPDVAAPERPSPPSPSSSAAHSLERLAPGLARQVASAIEPATRLTEAPQVSTVAPAQMAVTTPLPPPQAIPAPAAPSAPVAQLAPVDLGRADWVQAMVDRIAELPRAEGGREAQITLLPAALGKVEVTIIERDERMQVTINAETAQARQLLSDAAPRLQEQAEARGLRFAEPQVGGGQSQDRRGPHDQQQPQTPQRPRPVLAGRDENPQPQGDLIA